ncbi:MAG TPA: arsenite methyltransferase [Thermoguttaceae bacterium]|nr:arsenite methyltransferase [Thermoguttaceae bacterium]
MDPDKNRKCCCSAQNAKTSHASDGTANDSAREIVDVVRDRYGAVAKSGLSSQNDGVRAVAQAFGYSAEQLASIPAEANMGLSCGNPTAFAGLRPGEVVVDLGCGGGLDVFLAAAKVGPTGKAIGIDMTPEMIDRARRNAAKGSGGKPFTNVEFHLSTIDRLPLADASVDCVISNCVINLVPDKRAVFREVARVLKPGGRLAVSDLVLKKPLPPELVADLAAYVGCIAGAIGVDEYRDGLREAGFDRMEIVDTGADLNAYATVEPETGSGCCGSQSSTTTKDAGIHEGMAGLCSRYDFNEYAASVKIYAIKS